MFSGGCICGLPMSGDVRTLHQPGCPMFPIGRHTATQRQAEGIADILRERNAYRDALAALVAAFDAMEGYRTEEEYNALTDTFDDALAAARRLVEG